MPAEFGATIDKLSQGHDPSGTKGKVVWKVTAYVKITEPSEPETAQILVVTVDSEAEALRVQQEIDNLIKAVQTVTTMDVKASMLEQSGRA